jgi:hypothetical protein
MLEELPVQAVDEDENNQSQCRLNSIKVIRSGEILRFNLALLEMKAGAPRNF